MVEIGAPLLPEISSTLRLLVCVISLTKLNVVY